MRVPGNYTTRATRSIRRIHRVVIHGSSVVRLLTRVRYHRRRRNRQSTTKRTQRQYRRSRRRRSTQDPRRNNVKRRRALRGAQSRHHRRSTLRRKTTTMFFFRQQTSSRRRRRVIRRVVPTNVTRRVTRRPSMGRQIFREATVSTRRILYNPTTYPLPRRRDPRKRRGGNRSRQQVMLRLRY